MEGFLIVKAILREVIDISQLQSRATKTILASTLIIRYLKLFADSGLSPVKNISALLM